MSMGKHLLYILAFADIPKIHVELGMTTKQLIREVEQVTERLSNEWPCDDCKRTTFCGVCERPGIWMNNARKKLEEYKTAEEEGRLFICPVRPYDDIYIIDQGIIIEASVDCYQVYVDNFYSVEVSYIKPGEEFYTEYDGMQLDMDNFGEIWFLTCEEAEKALEEMKKNNAAN